MTALLFFFFNLVDLLQGIKKNNKDSAALPAMCKMRHSSAAEEVASFVIKVFALKYASTVPHAISRQQKIMAPTLALLVAKEGRVHKGSQPAQDAFVGTPVYSSTLLGLKVLW